MKKNKIIIILTLVLAVLAVVLVLRNKKTTIVDNFAVEDISTVTKIFMTDKLNNKVILEKIDDQKWRLNNTYDASRQVMDMLLETISELKVKEPVSKAGRNNVIKWLATKNVKVEIYQMVYRINLFDKIKMFKYEKLTKVYYVGGETQDNVGTFMQMEGAEDPAIVYIPGFRGFVSPRFSAYETDWRAHNVFDLKISDIKSVKLEYPIYPDSSFEISREGRYFQMKLLSKNAFVKDFDEMKVLDYMSSFTNINFEAFRNNIGQHAIDSLTSKKPLYTLTVTDITGKKRVVTTYPKVADIVKVDEMNDLQVIMDQDRFYAKVNDGKDFVTIQFFAFEHLIRSADYFRKVVNK